jgi:GAF domain/Sel1 repeat
MKNALQENTASNRLSHRVVEGSLLGFWILNDQNSGDLDSPKTSSGSHRRPFPRFEDGETGVLSLGRSRSLKALRQLSCLFLREASPTMGTEMSSGMSLSQRFTLDRPSFEKFLAAAWVLQCVHDHLHGRELERDETIPELVRSRKTSEAGNSGIQLEAKPVLQLSPTPHSKREVLNCHPASDETLAELVEAQQAIEVGTLDLDTAMKRVVALSLRFTGAEGAAIWLFAESEFVYRAGAGTASDNERLRLAVLSSLAGAWPVSGKPAHQVSESHDSKHPWVADLGTGTKSLLVVPIFHGREVAGALSVFANPFNFFSEYHKTTVRLMSGLLSHALRKTDEVELRAVEPKTAKLETIEHKRNGHPEHVAATLTSQPSLLVLREPAGDSGSARRRASLNLYSASKDAWNVLSNLRRTAHINLTLRALRAAATATPVLLLAIVAALLLLETWRHEPFHSAQATSARSTSEDASKRTENLANQISPPETSHLRTTDPATLSVVQELSRFEIRGLHRQAAYGDADAAFTLGMAFETGRHVPHSCTQAAHWVAIAAEAGNSAAQYNLGLRYRDGDGVPANRAESEKWLRKASAGKNPKAQLALKMLSSG